MLGGLTMMMCECLKDREKKKADASHSHGGQQVVGFSTGTKSSKDSVCHSGEGEAVYCHIVKTNHATHLCVL